MTAEKKDRKPLQIKNLADLKRHIRLGTELVATAHQYHPDIVGLTRVVTKVQTNGFYSKIKDQPDHKWSTCNHGMGFWSPFNKAEAYHFTESTVQVLNTRKNDGSVQGINFSKWNSSDGRYYTFKGSAIDRSMSYSGLMKQLERNSIDDSENINQSGASRPESYVLGVLADLMESQTPEVQKDNNDKQKRKKRRI